jgi:hypothetical protein
MKHIFFVILVALLFGSIWDFFSPPREKKTNMLAPIVHDTFKEEKKMLSILSSSPNTIHKKIKKIALLDLVPLHKPDAHWPTYEGIAHIALKYFEETNPSYRPEIVFYNEPSDNDPRVPAKKIQQASEDGCLIGVGFTWSTLAGVAAEQAERSKFPYIAPTAVLDKVHKGAYSISLGVSAKKASQAAKKFLIEKKIRTVFIIENQNKIQEREYAGHLEESLKETDIQTRKIQYDTHTSTDYPVELENLDAKDSLIFVPGYTDLRYLVADIHKKNPEVLFLVGPQWSHDETPLTNLFQKSEINLYCISDAISSQIGRPAAVFLSKEQDKQKIFSRGVFKYSVLDSLTYALHALDKDSVRTTEDALKSMKNLGKHPFSAKTSIYVKNGDVQTELYLARWNGSQFVRI